MEEKERQGQKKENASREKNGEVHRWIACLKGEKGHGQSEHKQDTGAGRQYHPGQQIGGEFPLEAVLRTAGEEVGEDRQARATEKDSGEAEVNKEGKEVNEPQPLSLLFMVSATDEGGKEAG
jgi:hypothetical protein